MGQLVPVAQVAHAATVDSRPAVEPISMSPPPDRPPGLGEVAAATPAPDEGEGTATPAPTDEPTVESSETAPSTDEPIGTEEPTDTPTDTPTETSTATSTPTETPTSTPTETPTPTPMPDPITGLSVEAEVKPARVAAGQQATVTVTLRNSGSRAIDGLILRNALAEGLSFDAEQERGAGIGVEAESGDLVAELDELAPGGTLVVRYQVRAEQPAEGRAQAITDVLQVAGPGLEEPLVAEVTLLVVRRGLRWTDVRRGVRGSNSRFDPALVFLSRVT